MTIGVVLNDPPWQRYLCRRYSSTLENLQDLYLVYLSVLSCLLHTLTGPPGQSILPVINKLVSYQPLFYTDVSSQARLGIQSGFTAELELESIERDLGT